MMDLWNALPLPLQSIIATLAIVLPLLGVVAYYTYAERKVIGYMQVRIGRTGSAGADCCSPSPTR
jgi:NADH-quinone oxidoreductase subunit H